MGISNEDLALAEFIARVLFGGAMLFMVGIITGDLIKRGVFNGLIGLFVDGWGAVKTGWANWRSGTRYHKQERPKKWGRRTVFITMHDGDMRVARKCSCRTPGRTRSG